MLDRLRRHIVHIEQFLMNPLLRNPQRPKQILRRRHHPERPAQPEMVHIRNRHNRFEQRTQLVRIQPPGEQLRLTRLPGQHMHKFQPSRVPILQISQIVREHHRVSTPIPIQHSHRSIRRSQQRGRNRQHRRNPGPGSDQHMMPASSEIRRERPSRRGDLNRIPGTNLIDQPRREHPVRHQPHPDPRPLPRRSANRIRPPLVPPVDKTPQSQRLPRRERVDRSQLLRHVERHGHGVVTKPLDLSHPQRMEPGTAGNGGSHSNLLDVFERLPARPAPPQRFARSRAEPGLLLRIHRPAMRTSHPPHRRPQRQRNRPGSPPRRGPRRRDPGLRQLPPPVRADPIRRPSRFQYRTDLNRGVPGAPQRVLQVVPHRVHRRTTGVGRRNRHRHPTVLFGHFTQHTQIRERQHRQLRISDRRSHGDRGHHVAPGIARATLCSSASRKPICSVCTPSRPIRPETPAIAPTSGRSNVAAANA